MPAGASRPYLPLPDSRYARRKYSDGPDGACPNGRKINHQHREERPAMGNRDRQKKEQKKPKQPKKPAPPVRAGQA
jgi:hypothetical protein